MYVPKLLAIASAAAVLFLGIAVVLLLLNKADEEQAQTLDSYYFEARLEVEEREGARPVGRLTEPRPDVILAWYDASDQWRREYTFSDPRQRDLSSLQVSDGEQMWSYDGEVNSYYSRELPKELRDQPEALRQYASSLTVGFSFILGPLPARDMQEFFARYQLGGATWRRLGTERVLEKDAEVIEVDLGGGKTTFWIDPDYMFVLRYEAGAQAAGQPSIRAEITELEYNPKLGPERFTFEAPAGARQVEPPSAASSGSSRGSASIGPGQVVTVPAGFLAPAYIPDGYVSVGQGSSHSSGDETTKVNVRFQPFGQRGETEPYLVLEEQKRFGGLPESFKQGMSVSVGTSQAYISSSGGITTLAFWTNDLVISLTTNELPADELLRVAESLH